MKKLIMVGIVIISTLFIGHFWINFYLNMDQTIFEGIIMGIFSPLVIIGLSYLAIDKILDYF
jgi:hypothetical protein